MGVGIVFGIWDLLFFGDFVMFFEVFVDEWCQYFIDVVDGGVVVNMVGDLGDDLCCYCGGGRDRFWWFDFCVVYFKVLGQYVFQVDQYVVEYWEEG